LWDIPKNDAVEKKTMVYAGERWNSFKNSLTSRYLVERGKKFGMSAANDYSYIDKETWKAFVKSREEPSFLVSWLYYLVHQPTIILVLPNELLCYIIGEKKEGTKSSVL
jgi:hypothetical protein